MKMPFINDKPIRLIELFGGIGSQAMALSKLGVNFEHYRLVEFDKYPVASYNAIHSTNFTPTDITKIHGEDLGIVDTGKFCYLVTYSFPCQDLSVAGKQQGMSKGSNTRSGLLWEVERLLNETEHLPQLLLMENVPQVHSNKNREDFENWIQFLENKGYSNYWQDLNAKDYGVAQHRNRCFMVSILGNYCFYFPKPCPLTKRMVDYLENSVDEKYYIDNEKSSALIKKLIDNGTLPIERETIDLSINNPQRRTIANCISARTDRGISNRRAEGTGVIEYNCRSQSFRIRKLTPKECYRLMGFDDESFERAEQVNSNTQLYKQAGNSIVVDVLVAIFDSLLIHGRSAWLDELLEDKEES